MKKIFLGITMMLSITQFVQAQEKTKKITVPITVKEAFSKDYPKSKVSWEMEDGDYEAHLKIDGSDASAVYDKKGHRKAVELSIKMTEIPADALDYIKKNYPTNKIIETAKTTDDKNTVTYEVAIGRKGKTYDVLFDANGKFTKMMEAD
jgi:hypothetical protein